MTLSFFQRHPWVVFLAVHSLRLLVIPGFELVPQEAYYFLYSQHLALSYFDHPPALAYLLRLFTELFGATEFSLRFAMFFCSSMTGLLWMSLARKQLPDTWKSAMGWLLPTGMATVTSLIATPDVPLLLFWSLCLHQLHRAVFESKKSAWILAGISMGLAFDSKYTAVFLPFGLLLFLMTSREHRFWLKTIWPWLAYGCALAATFPVLVWNAQNGFASFLFQTAHRADEASGLGLKWLVHVLLTQNALLSMPLFLLLIVVVVRSRHSLREPHPYRLFWAAFFLPLFLAFLGISLFSLVKPNWLMPAYLTGILWVTEAFGRRWQRLHLAWAGTLHVLALIQLLFYPFRMETDDTWVGWKDLARQVQHLADSQPGVFIASNDDYKTSAELRFYTRLPVYGPNVLGLRGLQFDYLKEDLQLLKHKDAFVIDSAPRDFSPDKMGWIPDELTEHFVSVEELDPILILEKGRVLRKFRVFRCRNYLGRSSL